MKNKGRGEGKENVPGWERVGRRILARQVKQVFGVGGCVALGGRVPGLAREEVVGRDGKGLLQLQRRLDKGGDESRDDVPFDVAVEEPDAGVVGFESQNHVAVGVDEKGVAPHGHLGKRLSCAAAAVFPGAGRLVGAKDGLEIVAVQVEWVAALIEVVDDNLDNVVSSQDKGMRVLPVHGGVSGLVARAERGVERGDLGRLVGDVVEEGIVDSVAEVVHDDIERHGLVGLGQEFHAVVCFESHVIKGNQLVHQGRLGIALGLVVAEPARRVVVQVGGKRVEESLCPGMIR